MRGILTVFLSCFVAFAMVACGGGSSSSTPVVSTLSITPGSAAVPIGGSQTFTANVAAGTAVTWSLSGPGSINANGTYVAPSTFPSPNTITVTATAGSQTGSITGSVVFPIDNTANQSTPIKLGTSGGNVNDNSADGKSCCIGTLGSLLSRGGSLFILSNNHVLARSSKAANGEGIDQPGQAGCPAGSQGLPVATLSQQAALKPTSNFTNGACAGAVSPCGNSPSNVDSAIAQIDVTPSSAVDQTGAILDLGAAGPTSIAAAPPSGTPGDPATVMQNNRKVAKSGRTTGLTCSTIQSVTTTVPIAYDVSCGAADSAAGGFTAVYSNQVVVTGGTFSAGGDSGSLIVDATNAQPIALLYGGGTTSTVANPIADVIAAFTQQGPPVVTPTIVGGGDHPVSCDPTSVAANSLQVGAQSVSVSEQQVATNVRNRYATQLMAGEPAIRSVKVGASSDAAGKGALIVELTGRPLSPIPAVIEGVRTKLVYTNDAFVPSMTGTDLKNTISIKEAHENSIFNGGGIQGVGVGRSDDAPGETAIVIYTIQGVSHPEIPATIGGVRTKVIEDVRFRASHWNTNLEAKLGGACGKSQAAPSAASTALVKK